MTGSAVTVHAAERRALIEWGVIAGANDAVSRQLVRWLGAEPSLDLVRASVDSAVGLLDLQEISGRCEIPFQSVLAARDAWRPRLGAGTGDDLTAAAAAVGAHILVRGDADWPVQVDDLCDRAPFALYVVGDLGPLVDAPAVTITGSRAASAYGEHVAATLAAAAVDLGATVVSGGSYGIDARAHRAVLAADGHTVAVLAGGVGRLYPSGNADMLTRVGERGALVSEYPPMAAPYRTRFLERDRLMAALTDATVIVEAAARSGALAVAHNAATLGRRLGAVPGPVTSASSNGCHQLLKDGAAVITNAEDLRLLVTAG